MALAKTNSATIVGVSAVPVGVEANIGPGLPGMFIVGLAGAALAESKDRLKTAMLNVGLPWPKTKLVVNLSPADIRKSGSHFDLAICAAVLSATTQIDLSEIMILGEVGLDGSVKPVPGVLPALIAARESGMSLAMVPAGNEAEAALLAGLNILLVSHLQELAEWMMGMPALQRPQLLNETAPEQPDMVDVVGQPDARLGAEIAAAGGHHLFLVGPPGSGKSMIAARLPGLLPPLGPEQVIEATAVHSVSGLSFNGPVTAAPFVAPHHSVSQSALLGGGSGHPVPGAVSLAHHGVLFLDEVSEIPAQVLDSLRVPLEAGQVRLLRQHREVVFPAQLQLVLAANPCRCGAEEAPACTCSASTRRRYLSNVSGPLRDRIDLCVRTYSQGSVLGGEAEPTACIAERVQAARERAQHRWGVLNARIDPRRLRRDFVADDVAMAYLSALLADGSISQRGVDRSLKVAWTLADLAGTPCPGLDEVTRAIELHSGGLEAA
ncbi:YifB family Mg chelatase-like AAA ATPase [Corynebacterium sp. H128]|uniref:YifB family Mg chelatase-like AAA ATPase n=1 Tax=unclassified Corynebacterium TaxID=2624378 RepID=UPI0030949159